MTTLIKAKKNKFICKFCGKVLSGIECNDRFDHWIEEPKCTCAKTIEYNKLMGTKALDKEGLKKFIKDNTHYISSIEKIPFGKCWCGYDSADSEDSAIESGIDNIYACPKCGTLKRIV